MRTVTGDTAMAAKGTSNRGSANDISPSLDSLLSPPLPPTKPLVQTSLVVPVSRPSVLTPQSDRRLYHPNKFMVHALPRAAAQLVPDRRGNAIRAQNLSPRLMFNTPARVALCVRRKMRREVLHALKLTRKSGKGGGRRHRNAWSQIKC